MPVMNEQGQITIHTENIFPIIKKSLYSEREIFLRELISNSADAITKLRMVSFREEGVTVGDPEIRITLDKDKKQIAIWDNGIGMTAEEVKKYINQVAFSSAEEFIQKYGNQDPGQQIIGHFGLGFYSSFIVAKTVEIDTLSYRPGSEAVHWFCDGTTAFSLSPSDRTEVGTTVTLTLMDGEEEYLEPYRIKELVRRYCDFIPIPIKLDGEVINKQVAPWKSSPSSLTEQDYRDFYSYLYPFQDPPLFWIHVNTDYPFNVQGILYFPKLQPDIDPNKSQIKLYCNQVFVSDNCEEVIPKFLLPLRGVIDSPDIPLNVSRSFLQGDRTVRRIGDHISKKVADRLKELFKENFEEYVRIWPDLSLFIKFGFMNSDKFREQIKDYIIFQVADPAAEKPEYITLQTYLERNHEKQAKQVYYATDSASQAAYIDLHHGQGLEVLLLDSWIDTHFISALEQEYKDIKFRRVDADLDASLIDSNQGPELVDPVTNKTRSQLLVETFQRVLNKPKLKIQAQALKSESVPAIILLPEMMRRIQEMSAIMQQKLPNLLEEQTLVINTNHPLIKNLQTLQNTAGDPGLVDLICQQIYDLALMAQKNPDPATTRAFIQRSNELLTRLTQR
ncbi:MAG: molecular chaperone HtpG [Thermostichales cyanobacterium BF4_bins_65]